MNCTYSETRSSKAVSRVNGRDSHNQSGSCLSQSLKEDTHASNGSLPGLPAFDPHHHLFTIRALQFLAKKAEHHPVSDTLYLPTDLCALFMHMSVNPTYYSM